MNKLLKPAGTLLFGRAMIAQFSYEMELLGVGNPVVITDERYKRLARRAASMLTPGFAAAVKVTTEEPVPENDFLILAGGKDLADSYAADPRPKAWIILADRILEDFSSPCTDIIVLDAAFVRNKKTIENFMRVFAASVSDGLASCPGVPYIPKSFSYNCRTKVLAGDDALTELPGFLSSLGVKHPMVLTDQGIVAVGLFEKLSSVLAGWDMEVYDAIPPDSSSRVVNEISRIFNEKRRDGIIAMGGGSVLDTGKGVFMNVSLGEDDLTAFAGSNRIPALNTPFIAVPTTSGTGSEVTKVAVVSDEVRHRKILYVSANIQPDYGILDSRLTASLPPHLTSITGMDALSHATEAFTCLGKNPISDQMAWKAIELIRDNLIPVMTDPGNLNLRRNLALASNMAGQAFSNSMVGMVHTIGHSVGAVCHAPHGSCMAVLLPASLEYNYDIISPLLSELLTALTGEEYAASVPSADRARAAIDCIRGMNTKLRELTGERHPVSLKDILGRDGKPLVTEEDFPAITETSLGDASIIYNPVELRYDDIMGILKMSY